MNLDAWVQRRFKRVEHSTADLHDYQTAAEQFAYDNEFSALWLDTGLGKSAVILRLIYRLILNGLTSPVLIIAPKRVATVTWPDELAEWSFGAPLTYEIIRDEAMVESVNRSGQVARKAITSGAMGREHLAKAEEKARRKAAREEMDENETEALVKGALDAEVLRLIEDVRTRAASLAVRNMLIDRPAQIYLINRDQVEFLVDAFRGDWPFRTVIIDESSCLKNHRTNRWKALWKVRPLIDRMHELTATPAAEGYLWLFGQITLLDRGDRFGLVFTKYAERYFTQNKWTRKYELREGAEKEISDLVADIALPMKQEDYLDLQQPITSPIKVRLSDEAMALYRQMEEDFVLELPSGAEVEAETAAALSQKLSQLASGVVYDNVLEEKPDGTFKKKRVVHHVHDDKIDALRELEEELDGEHMLVSYYHQSSVERILAAFPQARELDKDGKRIAEWNKGKIKMLLIHPMSAGYGLNLQRGGRHIVFFDPVYSLEAYYQTYRRLARQGQKGIVIIHQLVTTGTIDDVVFDCLREKKDVQDEFFKLVARLRRKLALARQPDVDAI